MQYFILKTSIKNNKNITNGHYIDTVKRYYYIHIKNYQHLGTVEIYDASVCYNEIAQMKDDIKRF